MSEKTQVVAALYTCELKLQSHEHRLESDQREALEEIVESIQDLRFDLQPTHFFGDLE